MNFFWPVDGYMSWCLVRAIQTFVLLPESLKGVTRYRILEEAARQPWVSGRHSFAAGNNQTRQVVRTAAQLHRRSNEVGKGLVPGGRFEPVNWLLFLAQAFDVPRFNTPRVSPYKIR